MKIKRSFRLLMSGPTSQSMTQKGLGYKINWGVPFIELKKMALEYGKDYELAIELWKEDIRECKILATLIMPAEKMLPEITDIWMEQVKSQEMAEMLAFNLLQYVDYAPAIAYEWIATDKTLYEIAGFQLLALHDDPRPRTSYQGTGRCLCLSGDRSSGRSFRRNPHRRKGTHRLPA